MSYDREHEPENPMAKIAILVEKIYEDLELQYPRLRLKEAGHAVDVVGPNAGDLIAEATLAIEMGADAEDIGLTIHPHPTLSETIGMAAEAFEGTITDLYLPKRR